MILIVIFITKWASLIRYNSKLNFINLQYNVLYTRLKKKSFQTLFFCINSFSFLIHETVFHNPLNYIPIICHFYISESSCEFQISLFVLKRNAISCNPRYQLSPPSIFSFRQHPPPLPPYYYFRHP